MARDAENQPGRNPHKNEPTNSILLLGASVADTVSPGTRIDVPNGNPEGGDESDS